MHLRVITIRNGRNNGKNFRDLLENLGSIASSMMDAQEHLHDLTITADHERGLIENVFFWKSAEALVENSKLNENQVDAEGRPVRHLFEAIDGWQVVEVLQEATAEFVKTPAVGSAVHVRRLALLSSGVDDYVRYLRGEVIPRCMASGGFVGARLAADLGRICGLALVYLYWEDEAAMKKGVAQEKVHEAAHPARILEETFREVYA